MDGGSLVPDDVISEMTLRRCRQDDCVQRGFILDGFPRTAAQAAALNDASIELTHFVLLDAHPEMLVDRVIYRRIDRETGEIYHLKHRPPPEHRLQQLLHRPDDTAAVMNKRLDVYKQQTAAVVEHFNGAQHIKCDENDSIFTTFTRVIQALETPSPLHAIRQRSSVSSHRLMAKL